MAKAEMIAPSKVIKVGERVEVSISTDAENNSYSSRIEDYDTDELIMAMPMREGYPIIPMTGSVVHVTLLTNMCMYRFAAVYIGKKADPIPVWVVSMPREVEKYQRRQFVRVEVMLPVKIRIEETTEDGEKVLSAPVPCYSRDISGGGMRIVSKQKIRRGAVLQVETGRLPFLGFLNTRCEVVRCAKPASAADVYWIGVKFLEISPQEQSRLVRFIFDRQREILSRRVEVDEVRS